MSLVVTGRLSKILTEKDIKQKELALMTGLTEPTISRFDKQTRYDIETLFRISRALNSAIEDLFEVIEI